MKVIVRRLLNTEVVDDEIGLANVFCIRFAFEVASGQYQWIDANEMYGKLSLIGNNSLVIEPQSSNSVLVSNSLR